jgi:hypothetical protein
MSIQSVQFSHHGLVPSGKITMRYKTLWLCGCLVSLMIQIACLEVKKAWAFWLWVSKSVQEYLHRFVRSCETEIWYKRLWTSRLLSTTHLSHPCDQNQSRTRPWVSKTETIRHYEFECSRSTSMREKFFWTIHALPVSATKTSTQTSVWVQKKPTKTIHGFVRSLNTRM